MRIAIERRVEVRAHSLARNRAAAIALIAAALLLCVSCGNDPTPAPAKSDGLVLVREIDGVNELVWVRLSDGQERAVTSTRDRSERWPYWSDAAQHLVFQAQPVRGGDSDLYLWRPGSAAPVRIRGSSETDERWPVWSPSGEQLVYAFRDSSKRRAGIVAERMGGGSPEILAFSGMRTFFFRPSFSPDGSQLVAQRRRARGKGSTLWILASGVVPKPLTSDPGYFDMKPWFTRQGDRVVFSRRPIGESRRDIALIAPETREVRVIVNSPESDDHSARPSPTRDEIAFSSDRSGSFDVYLTDYEGGSLRALTAWPDRSAFAPRWSHDGNRLSLTVVPVGAPESIASSHTVVIDRDGRIELDVAGAMADWMADWKPD